MKKTSAAVEKNSLCGSMQIYRTRSRITGGFWNDCRLVCRNHHPFKGTQTEDAYLVGFRFTQRGRPDGHTTIRTQTGGAGSGVFIGPNPDERPFSSGRATHGTKVFTIDEIPGAVDLRLGVRMNFAAVTHDDEYGHMTLTGQIETPYLDQSLAYIHEAPDQLSMRWIARAGSLPGAIDHSPATPSQSTARRTPRANSSRISSSSSVRASDTAICCRSCSRAS